MMEYHRDTKHPAYDLQRSNWRNMNGEDIELGNRALSHCSKSVRGQSEYKILHRSYRLLGCMLDTTSTLKNEIARFKSMKTWTSSKKMKYEIGQPTVQAGIDWMLNLVDELMAETFQHYQLTGKNPKKRGRPPGAKNLAPGEVKVKPKLAWSEYNVATKADEERKKEIQDVAVLYEFDWVSYARDNIASMLKRQWRTGKNFDPATLEGYDEQKDFYFK
jgi:hypothetical protein